jgi:hypothetical protein
MPKMGDNNQPVYDIQYGCVVDSILKNWSKGEGEKGRVEIDGYKGVWTIIDEFNRADIDKAIGQLFTSLRTKKMKIPTNKVGIPYEDLKIPNDYRIIGTLNTADKHWLFKLSDALKSRFAFIEVDIPSKEQKDEEIYYAMKNAMKELSGHDFDFVSLDEKNKKIAETTLPEFKEMVFDAYNCLDLVRCFKKLGTAILKLIYQNLLVGMKMKQDPRSILDYSLSTNLISQLEGLPQAENQIISASLKGEIINLFKNKIKSPQDNESYVSSFEKILDYIGLEKKKIYVNNFSKGNIQDDQWEKLERLCAEKLTTINTDNFSQVLQDLGN